MSEIFYWKVVQAVLLFGGIELGFVGVNVQEAGWGACGVPQIGDGKNRQATEGWYLEKRSRGECTQSSGDADTGDIH